MESQCEKVAQSSCICVHSYSFSISLFDKWMWNGTILDNRTRLLMKLLTTSSADSIQECRVTYGVKSVSKSIFKRRRNGLPVVVFKMSNIRRKKLNNEYTISATQLTAQRLSSNTARNAEQWTSFFVRLQLAARVAQFIRGICTFVDRNAHCVVVCTV